MKTKRFLATLLAAVVLFTLVSFNTAFAAEITGRAIYVHYDANGGTGAAIADTEVIDGEAIVAQNTYISAQKKVTAFKCWNTKADGTGVDYTPGDRILSVNEDVTLYCKWENFYNVTYRSNGGKGATADKTAYFIGDKATVVENKFSRSLYTFVEWATAIDGSGTSYKPGDEIEVTGAIVLYALWVKNPVFSVLYDANGAEGTVVDTLEGNPNTREYDLGEPALVKSSSTLTYAEHSFKGWNTKADGTGTTYFTNDTITSDVDATLTLYAMWEARNEVLITYHLNYDANGGEGEMLDPNGPYIAGGLGIAAINEFTRTNFFFVSWNTAPDGTGVTYEEFDDIDIESDLTLYAIWERDITAPCTMTYSANGVAADDIVETFAYGDEVVVPDCTFVNEGYVFSGWNTAPDGTGNMVEPGTSGNIVDDGVLYAMWVLDEESENVKTGAAASAVPAALALALISMSAVVIVKKKAF